MPYRRRRVRRKRSSIAWRARRKAYGIRRRGRMVTRKYPLGRTVGPYRKLNIGGFPKQKVTYLRYVENFTLNPGTAPSSVAYTFRSNGLFDTNLTGTGHQPMYFDNYMALYGTYQVMKATIRFILLDNHIVNTTIGNQTSGNTVSQTQNFAFNERAARMFIIEDPSATDYPTDLNTLIEEGSPHMVWKFAPNNTSQYCQSLYKTTVPHKLLDVGMKDIDLQGTASLDPTIKTYFICGLDSFPGSNADTMNCQAIITYKVRFADLKLNQTQN